MCYLLVYLSGQGYALNSRRVVEKVIFSHRLTEFTNDLKYLNTFKNRIMN